MAQISERPNKSTFHQYSLKDSERNAATPAEERSDETPQELATRRLSASRKASAWSAESCIPKMKRLLIL
ncbi:hypothetical protein AJGP001_12940 [Planococcus faecalis]|uniref:Uncharacterized protein n=1 Tax=Planococcus faecalis TaxID=1598147 RepID=A0ABM6IU71_9BACL|nr:hypothetical protein AJGP001_12940 [Planococcus faecalis]OHX52574.1 hypothetical protein BB777_03455 [Planococcus faecalis]